MRRNGATTSLMPTRRGELFPLSPLRMLESLERIVPRFMRELPELTLPTPELRWGLNLEEKPDALIVRAEVPGFNMNEIALEVEGDVLTIRAEHKVDEKAEKEGEPARWLHREYIERIALPAVDTAKATASYVNGILTVTLPRTEAAKPHRIAVTPGS